MFHVQNPAIQIICVKWESSNNFLLSSINALSSNCIPYYAAV